MILKTLSNCWLLCRKPVVVAEIKLSEYGITKNDLPEFVKNARKTMGRLFSFDPRPLSDEDILAIYTDSYK